MTTAPVLLLALALAPTETLVFDVNQAASNFTWTGNSAIGVVNPDPTNAFQVFGTVTLELESSGAQPLVAGRIVAADIQLVPEFAGVVPNPLFPSLALATLQVNGQHFTVVSDPFTISATGAFSTTVVLTTTQGAITVNAFGQTFVSDLTGTPSDPAAVSGQLDHLAGSLHVSAPLVATFGFVDPGTGVTGSFTVTGVLDATHAELWAPSFCSGDGGASAACTPCPCANDAPAGSGGGCLNSAGTSAHLAASGVPAVFADTLRFELSGANPSTFAILTSGTQRAPNNPANPCFGLDSGLQAISLDGLRCVVNGVQRHGARATDAGGAVGATNNGWGAPSGPPGGLIAQGGFSAGQTRHFQAIYRENPLLSCMRGQNSTQGVSVTLFP